MSGPGKPRTTYAQFAKGVAERSGYHLYEIKEIMRAIAMEAYVRLRDEGRASIAGIGTIYTVKAKPKVLRVPMKDGTLQDVQVPEKTRVMFKISDAVKEYIEPNYKHKNYYRRFKKCQK